jgi:hypothetical protein
VSEGKFVLREFWRIGDREFFARDEMEAEHRRLREAGEWRGITYGYKMAPASTPLA